MKIYIGLDDSGRGPVIGSMFLAAVAVNEKQKKHLESIGVKDSKEVERNRRKYLEKEIKRNSLTFKVISISPKEIDLKNKFFNLNKIEAMKFGELINKIYKEIRKKNIIKNNSKIIIIVDCPSPNIKKWKLTLYDYIKDNVKNNAIIIAKHKAEKHVFVAAASILAKEKREREIEMIKRKIGDDFGSGYPSDPRTIDFLKKHINKNKKLNSGYYFIRESWQTTKEITKEKEKKKQKKLKDFFY